MCVCVCAYVCVNSNLKQIFTYNADEILPPAVAVVVAAAAAAASVAEYSSYVPDAAPVPDVRVVVVQWTDHPSLQHALLLVPPWT